MGDGGVEKIIIGNKFENGKYDFRETCFGICLKGDLLVLVKKNEQFSFIGGGIENGETREACLRREDTVRSCILMLFKENATASLILLYAVSSAS